MDKVVWGQRVLFQAAIPGYTCDDAIAAIIMSAFKAGDFGEVEIFQVPDTDGMYIPKFEYTP